MEKVICNSIGKNEECPYCSASKHHIYQSCEPCLWVKDAKCIPLVNYEYGAMSSKYTLQAENKYTAYVAMVYHYNSNAHLIMLYEPKEVVKPDVWINLMGQITHRLDEIFVEVGSFDEYYDNHIPQINAAYDSIKQLV